MFDTYPTVVFQDMHPYSVGDVTTQCEPCSLSLASCVFPSPAQRVLIDSFSVMRLPAMVERFGASCQILGIFEPSQRCVFAMLFSAESRVRKIWAHCLEHIKCDHGLALSPKRVLIDFVSVPRQNSSSIMHYVFLALDYLRFCGYSSIITECQELRLLSLWMRKSVHLLNPPPFVPVDRVRKITRQRARQSCESANTVPYLLDGEKLFTSDGRWRLYLKEPVYFTYDIDGEVFVREKECVLGSKDSGLRLASSRGAVPIV